MASFVRFHAYGNARLSLRLGRPVGQPTQSYERGRVQAGKGRTCPTGFHTDVDGQAAREREEAAGGSDSQDVDVVEVASEEQLEERVASVRGQLHLGGAGVPET